MGRCSFMTGPGGNFQRRTVLTASWLSSGQGDADLAQAAMTRPEGRLEAQPPDHAVEQATERQEESGEDGPHDPAALKEGFDDDVGEHGAVC